VPCAILGDSLAAGVAVYRRDCASDTKVGITSARYATSHMMSVDADTVLISLGVNDGVPDRGTAESGREPATAHGGSTGSCRHTRTRHGASSPPSHTPATTA